MVPAGWRLDFDGELARAEKARAAGNEGQARVCARRAAGIVLREFLRQTGTESHESAYELIVTLSQLTSLKKSVREILFHLQKRVEPGGTLADSLDLLADVKQLPKELGLE